MPKKKITLTLEPETILKLNSLQKEWNNIRTTGTKTSRSSIVDYIVREKLDDPLNIILNELTKVDKHFKNLKKKELRIRRERKHITEEKYFELIEELKK